MKKHSPASTILFLSCGLYCSTLSAPPAANAISTTFNGETLTWDISGIGNITDQGCSTEPTQYGCHYIAPMPAPGTRVQISASITPNQWAPPPFGVNWLQLYNVPAGTVMTDRCDQWPDGCDLGTTLSLSGATTFANAVPIPPYNVSDGFMIHFDDNSSYTHNSVTATLRFFNNSPFTIDARPDLLGGPEDNDCIAFSDGTQRPRWEKERGKGPGL